MNLYTKFIIDLLENTNLLEHEGIRKSLTAIDVNPNLREKFLRCISPEIVSNHVENDPFQPYPKPEDIGGIIKLGNVLPINYTFGLEIDQLMKNILILGAHGTGKTNVINLIIENLYRLGIPFLVIDVAKKDSRHLIRRLPELQVIRARDFRMNPLEGIRGINPLTILSDFVDAYCHQIEVMQRSKSYIVRIVKELWNVFGIFEGNEEYPNLEDMELLLSEKLKTPGNRNDDFLLKNHQRIGMHLTLTGDMYRCSKGFPLERILENPAVLELDEFSEDAKTGAILFLLTRILRYRISRGERGKLLHVVIFDEGKRVFDYTLEKNFYMGIPPLDFLVSYARDFGEGLIVADQEASKLTNTIKACSNTKISFMVSGKDINETARILGLNECQREVLQQLSCGIGIVKMDERYTKPFLVKFNHLEIERTVTDEEVEEHSRKFVEELNKEVKPRSRILIERVKSEERLGIVSKEEENFLINVAKRPELTILERFKSLGLTNYMGSKIVKSLVFKGYIKKIKVFTGQRGNQPIILELTDKGKEYLKSIGIKLHSEGKGGILHQWWQKKIQEFYKNLGQKAVIEPTAWGANTDILIIESSGRRIAVEVALSKDGQTKNIQRDLKYFDKVLVACGSRRIMERVKEEALRVIDKEDLKRVSFCLLQDFYNEI
jgi:DNA-binding MarR family transcriptional regulator